VKKDFSGQKTFQKLFFTCLTKNINLVVRNVWKKTFFVITKNGIKIIQEIVLVQFNDLF